MHNTEPKNLSDPIQFENENNIQLIVYFTNKQMSFFFFFFVLFDLLPSSRVLHSSVP